MSVPRPHVGITGGRCNFCGVKMDNMSRGRTCEAANKEWSAPVKRDKK